MEVCGRRDVPRQDVAVRVLGDGRLVQAQIDLGREQHQSRGPDRIHVLGAFEQEGVGQAAATRVAGEEDALAGDAQGDELRVGGRGVLGPGRVGELRRKPVVGDERRALGLPAHPRREERIHRRRRADVPATVEVEDHPYRSAAPRHVEDARHAAELRGVALDVEGTDKGRHDPLADLVQHELERPELGDAQRRGVAHEGADHLPGDRDPQVGQEGGRTVERTAERHPCQRRRQLLRQQRHVQSRNGRRCGLYLRTVAHCHVFHAPEAHSRSGAVGPT